MKSSNGTGNVTSNGTGNANGCFEQNWQTKKCNIYSNFQKVTATGDIDGIRQNLVLSAGAFILFVSLFSILRRRLWDYGVLAVIQRYSSHEDLIDSKQFFENSGRSARRPADKLRPKMYKLPKSYKESKTLEDKPRSQWWLRQRQIDKTILEDRSCCGWIRTMFSLTQEDYLHSSGPDCVKYLILQKHLIFLTFVWTLVSLCVTLPLNYQGSRKDSKFTFPQTTLNNLLYQPKYLYGHISLALVFILLTMIVLRHYSEYLIFFEDFEDDAYRSVFIQGLNTAHNARITERTIRDHFQAIYPNVEIREVLILYNFSELFEHFNYLQRVHQSLLYYEAYGQLYGRTPRIVGCCCGVMCYYVWCPCRCCCSTVDALEFYEDEERRTKKLLLYEAGSRLKSRSMGMAVVTFENVEVAFKCINDHSWAMKWLKKVPLSEFSRRLTTDNWSVSLAPYASDLQWGNITSGVSAWYIRYFFLNVLTVVIVVFYSTPVYILQSFQTVHPLGDKKQNMDQEKVDKTETVKDVLVRFTNDTLPALLLVLTAVSLPSLVTISDVLAGFWTRSSEHRSKMLKTFWFLVLCVIVLPAVGLVTLTKLIGERSIQNVVSQVMNWECILAPENGELFVNVMCTATFVGTICELLRIPELLQFIIFACCQQSPAELRKLKKDMLYEFPMGSQYAYMLSYYVMFCVFSFIFPMITPFGFLYILMKHLVDRYNMYFVYGPCVTPKEIHGLASSLVMLGAYLAQFMTCSYCITQAYYHRLKACNKRPKEQDRINRSLIFFSYLALAITLLPYILNLLCGWFWYLMPVFYRRTGDPDVAFGPFGPQRRLYYQNRLEVYADPELKGFYNKSAANRRFAPKIFHDLTFLTSYSQFMNRKNVPCHDSSESELSSQEEEEDNNKAGTQMTNDHDHHNPTTIVSLEVPDSQAHFQEQQQGASVMTV